MSVVRTTVVGGFIAYKGLFHWVTGKLIVPTLLLNPALQLLTFTMIGVYAGGQPAAFYAIGNAVHAMARASVFSATVIIAAERTNGTLGTVLSAPAGPMPVFGGRLIPAVATGYVSSLAMLGLATVVTDAAIPAASLPAVLLLNLLIALSCSALGLCLGAIGLYLRDVFFLPNVAVYGMMLLCGVNLTAAQTPVSPAVSGFLPLTNGLAAIRDAVAGAPVGLAAPSAELGLAVGYGLLAVVLLRLFAYRARAGATLDLGA